MSNRTLWILIALEAMGAAVLILHRHHHQATAQINYALVDDATAADLRRVHQDLMQSVAAGKDTMESWLAMADAYATYGYFRAANRYYRRAMQFNALDAKATFRWALCLDRLARFPEAIGMFERTARLTRDRRRHQACDYFIGKIHLKREQPAAAMRAFRKGGNYVPCQYEMANLLIRTGRVDDVKPMLELIDRYPNAIGTHLIHARAAEARGDLKTAASHFDAAERGDEMPFYLTDRGFLKKYHPLYGTSRMSKEGYDLARQGKKQEGLELLHTAYRQNRVVQMQPLIIRLEMAVSGPQAARRLIQDWTDRAGQSPEFLEVLGDTFWEEGNDRQAEAAWLHSVKFLDTSSVHEKLARLYQQRLDVVKARFHRGQALYEKGVAAYRANELETARQILVQAVEKIPQKANGWFYLGQTYRVLQKLSKAREAYERCLAIDPYHGRAGQFLHPLDAQANP